MADNVLSVLKYVNSFHPHNQPMKYYAVKCKHILQMTPLI